MAKITNKHTPKAWRSSTCKSVYRSMSNMALEELAKSVGKDKGDYDAQQELERRRKKREKKAAKA